jgi:nucleoside-diphosphate-sugar epimerase
MSELQVVIGSGTVGRKLAKFLAEDNKQVVVLTRSGGKSSNPAIEIRTGDATSLESLLSAASKPAVIYNCANPPYTQWKTKWPKISSAVNQYAMQTGAKLVTCSNLYGYGPYEGVITEEVPLNATWENGRARAQVWLETKALNDAGKLRATEVRGSDYLCANEQSRMGHRVIPNLLLGKPVHLLGQLDQPHTWTDPDDVARLMIRLAEDDKSWGRPWHVPSNPPKTQREVVADIAKELGVTSYKLSAVGAAMEGILGLFNPLIRELNRGAYQFNKPFVVSSEAAQKTFGLTPKPWDQIIRDLVKPYLDYSKANGKEALAKMSDQRID